MSSTPSPMAAVEDGRGTGPGVAATPRADEWTPRAFVEAVLDLVGARSPGEAAQALADACTLLPGVDAVVVSIVDGEAFFSWGRHGQAALQEEALELPIVVAGGPYAVMRLERSGRDFDDTARRVALLLASHAAVVFERLALGLTPNERTFDEDDVAFLVALAGPAAQVLERAQRSRAFDRTARLQTIAMGLSSASSLEDVAGVILEQGGEALGANAGIVVRVDDDGDDILEVLGARGRPAERVAAWPRRRVLVRPAPDPVVAAVTSGDTVLLASVDEIHSRFPAAAEELAAIGAAAVAAVPLKIDGATVGAVGFTFGEPREFAPEDRMFLGALSELCAQAVQRARLFATVEASRNHLRELLERLQEGLLAVTPSLRVEFANAEAARMLGDDGLVGTALPERWQGVELGAFARGLFVPGASSHERRFDADDARTYELVGIPGSESAVIVVRDVSRREHRERAEREFVANAAHELRSPLAGILAAVDALQLGARELPLERGQLLDGIHEEAHRLDRLVHALLALARAQADPGSLVGHTVELAPLVTEIARTLEVRPAVRVVVDEGDPACLVIGERVLIEVALQNLARNASRHTERGSIAFGWNETGDGRVAIHVRDTGSGMPAEVVDRAFDRFYRGGTDHRAGFGLGLPLVREMMRILGGDVAIESTAGAGTTARLILRAA